ncbi:MAG: hypothetical protein AAB373_01980 [Patescibacteria group bacterium]
MSAEKVYYDVVDGGFDAKFGAGRPIGVSRLASTGKAPGWDMLNSLVNLAAKDAAPEVAKPVVDTEEGIKAVLDEIKAE